MRVAFAFAFVAVAAGTVATFAIGAGTAMPAAHLVHLLNANHQVALILVALTAGDNEVEEEGRA